MEFWNEMLTKASWEKLTELSREISFILIGGWAAYLWTGLHKSKDIDIVVDYDVLAGLQKKYSVNKNDNLKKYEIKFDKYDIDIYLPHYSKLAIPSEDLKKYTIKVKGITTAAPEALLILKQGAEIERRNTVKGKKDAIDILTLLIHAPFDIKKYKEILSEYKKKDYIRELMAVIKTFDERDIHYLNMDFLKFKKWKSKILEMLKKKMKTAMSRKAQLTMFVILGIVIIAIFGFVFFATGEITRQRAERQAEKIFEEILDTTALKFYVSQCAERALENATDLISKQGGKLTPNQLGSSAADYGKTYLYTEGALGKTYYVNYGILKEETPTPQYPCKMGFDNYEKEPDFCNYRRSPFFNNMDFGIVNLPSLCKDRHGGCSVKEGWSQFSSVQAQLETYVSRYVKGCVDFESVIGISEAYEIEEGDVSANITFSDRDITALVSFPLIISVPGEQPVVRLAKFQNSYPTRFKQLYSLAREAVIKDVSSPTAPDFDIVLKFRDLADTKFRVTDQAGFVIMRKNDASSHDDLIRILDTRAAQGTELLFQFMVENRPPVLEYINPFGPVGKDPPDGCKEYDIIQMQDSELVIDPKPLSFDTEEDELTITYSGWLKEYDETNTAVETAACPRITSTQTPYTSSDQERWSIDSNGKATAKLIKDDVGPHRFTITVCDTGGLCDSEDIRVLIDDYISIGVEKTNPYGGPLLSLEDPFTFTASINDMYNPGAYSFNWIVKDQSGNPLKEYSAGEQDLIFPGADYNIINIHDKYLQLKKDNNAVPLFELTKSYNIFAQVIQAGEYLVENEAEATIPVACIPNKPTEDPFPYSSSPNPFLAGHTCCNADNTIKLSGANCYNKDTYGSYKSFNSERYKTSYDTSYTPQPTPAASNDIFKRSFIRKCDGTRGNICGGAITETYSIKNYCPDDKTSSNDIALCSGPKKDLLKPNSESPLPPPTDGAYCEKYDRTTFEKEAGTKADNKCNTNDKCVSNIDAADGYTNVVTANAHYICNGATCGGNGLCSRPVECTDCYAQQTCKVGTTNGPTASTPDKAKTFNVKKFNDCQSTACSFTDLSLQDTCSGNTLTDYYCVAAPTTEEIYKSAEFDCRFYNEKAATDDDGGDKPLTQGKCTQYVQGSCLNGKLNGKCNEGTATTTLSDGRVSPAPATGYLYREYYPADSPDTTDKNDINDICAYKDYDYDSLNEATCNNAVFGGNPGKWNPSTSVPVGNPRKCCYDDNGETWNSVTNTCTLS